VGIWRLFFYLACLFAWGGPCGAVLIFVRIGFHPTLFRFGSCLRARRGVASALLLPPSLASASFLLRRLLYCVAPHLPSSLAFLLSAVPFPSGLSSFLSGLSLLCSFGGGWVSERWGACVRGPGEWVSGSGSEVRGYKRSEVLGVVQVGMVILGVGRWRGRPIQVGN
jgi:hypothetical protein